MKRNCTKIVCVLLQILAILALSSCAEELEMSIPKHPQKVEVGFYAGGTRTRTTMLSNGLSAEWTDGDQIAVWAVGSDGSYTLSNQIFKTYGVDGSRGFFTTELDAPMEEDRYTYYCCYPAPSAINGTTATFYVPPIQDGKVTGGADVMVAVPVTHGALTPVPEPEDHSGLRMEMKRMMHQFRFWVPSDDTVLGSEEIERLFLTFPTQVVGDVQIDIANPERSVLASGFRDITLMLDEKVSKERQNYACVAFVPTKFSEGQSLQLKGYTDDKIVLFDPIDLKGRNCEAGHSTPVILKARELIDYGRIRFTVSGNNIGEDANSVTLTAPSGCTWGDTGSNVYTYSPGYKFSTGTTFEIVFEDVDIYRAFSGQSITVSFDTEHVTTTETITLPDMSSRSLTEIKAGLPYLLYEDFSSVPSFSSSDDYGISNAGSKSAYSFLNGWTGGRVGAEASKCIRIACRRETSADYDARVDSAPILQLKKPARISVTFDYGMNNQFGGISLITNPDVGQTYFIGYVTSTEGYKSGDDDGTFETENQRYLFEKSGSYDSTPNTDTYYLNNVPTGTVRITWRTEVQHQAGTNNTTCWLYIDNVKVQIANN